MQPRNPYLCLFIVVFLGASGVLGVVGMFALAMMGRDVPPAAVAIASGAFGSLASFLVNVPRGSVGGDQMEGKKP